MDIRECLAVRRAYGNVRQSVPAKNRLTFEEFAILAKLAEKDEAVLTSDIARWQNSLRPTMTRRFV